MSDVIDRSSSAWSRADSRSWRGSRSRGGQADRAAEAPQLEQARTIYAFANPVARWLILVVAALYVAAFLLSGRRPRMTVIIGVALVANALLLRSLSIGRQLFINELAGTVFGLASSVFYDTLGAYLERGWQVLGWLGLILVVGVGSPGPTPPVPPSARPCPAAWSPSGHSWPTGRSAVPVGGRGQRPVASGRGGRGWCRRPAVGTDVSVSRLGWSLLGWSPWRSCRSWSGLPMERIVVRAPERRAPTLHDQRQTQARCLLMPSAGWLGS